MSNDKKTVLKLKVDCIETTVDKVEQMFKTNPDSIICLEMDSIQFPNRIFDFPDDVQKYILTHPKVKVEWEYNNHLVDENVKTFLKIIIPCWNVESVVGKMLDSILGQTFQDFHIVCVEDCSTDNTLGVLQDYKNRYNDKISLIKNQKNLGAGETRNQGYFQTLTSIPSEFVWIVDGDDYLPSNDVFQRIYDYCVENPQKDIINIGWTCMGEYRIADINYPIGFPGCIIRTNVYVPGISKNISPGDDVFSHYMMFDNVDDDKIGKLDYNCYVYPKSGRHINNTDNNLNMPLEIGKWLMTHRYRKQSVVESILCGESGLGNWIRGANPQFTPYLICKPRKVSIIMASFPYRKKWMLQSISQLMPQCDNFYLWLNEYKEIPEELMSYDSSKLHITLSNKDMKDNGRYLFMERECLDDYCFICDDDINYPINYIDNTLQCFQRNGEYIVVSYYKYLNQFNSQHDSDMVLDTKESAVTPHYRFGSGVMAFIPSVVKFGITMDELNEGYDIEMIFGQHCIDHKINVISPIRPAKFIRFISDTDASVDEYALHLHGSKQRIRKTNEYLKRKRR